MRHRLLCTTAAAMLIAGMSFAVAQAPGGSSSAPSAAPSGSSSGTSNAPATGSGSTMQDRQGSSTMSGDRPAAAGDRAQTPDRQGAPMQSQRSQDSMPAQSQQRTGQGDQNTQGGRRQDTTGAAPSAGGKSITTQQRTEIRQRLGSFDRARVDRVDFSLSVGVAVPRSVTLYDLPAEIVTIVPAYRGYKFVIVRDEIIIIDPRTHMIVAIIEA